MRLAVLLLLLATVAPAPPNLTASWDSATSATIAWLQSDRACLYRQPSNGRPVFIACYDRFPAAIRVELGHAGPLSGDLRPTAGDVYILVTNDGATFRAALRARAVYFPAFL